MCVSLAGQGAEGRSRVSPRPSAPCSSFPPPTCSSLMSPLGTRDLTPRGPFTWLTKVRKQTFFSCPSIMAQSAPWGVTRLYPDTPHWFSQLAGIPKAHWILNTLPFSHGARLMPLNTCVRQWLMAITIGWKKAHVECFNIWFEMIVDGRFDFFYFSTCNSFKRVLE